MKIVRALAEVPFDRNSVVTVGTFDGIHCAHREIIREVTKRAGERRGRSVVITFDPHPKEVVASTRGSVKLLTTMDERIALFASLKVDVLFIITFTFEFSRLTAEEFYRAYVVDAVGASEVVVGYDHMFGRDRQGTVQQLEVLGARFGFAVTTVPPFVVDGDVVSSTQIRKALAAGDIARATDFLGRPYRLSGLVVTGDRRGSTLGYPTANLRPEPENKVVPGHGVYLVRVTIGSRQLYGMMNIGVRPTVTAGMQETIEVHILDFQGDLYNAQIAVEFLRKLRDERKFGSVQELVEQLGRDRGEALRAITEYKEHR